MFDTELIHLSILDKRIKFRMYLELLFVLLWKARQKKNNENLNLKDKEKIVSVRLQFH